MQTKQRLDVPLSLKSVSDSGEFEGYGSVFGVKDSHDDVVMSGAFAASLRAWSDRKALPALLWQHRMDEPIGVYTEMKEDDVGLYVRGRLLIDDDPLAKRAHAHMKAGSLPGYVPDMGEGYPDQCHHLAGNRADRGRHHPLHHHSLPPGDHC